MDPPRVIEPLGSLLAVCLKFCVHARGRNEPRSTSLPGSPDLMQVLGRLLTGLATAELEVHRRATVVSIP